MKSLKLQIKAVAATLLLLLFCLPFIILLIKLPISLNFHFSFNEFYQALSNAMEQSIISVIITLLLGYMGALGLVSITKSTILRKIEMVMVLPIFLPQLFVVISVSNSMFFLFGEYKGLKSILFINTLMNIGLVSVILSHSIRHIAGGPLKLAYIEGASFLQKMQQIFILIKRDFLFLGLFLFSIFFTSFSVPALVGGMSNQNIEVLIYEQIRVHSNYSFAMLLSLFQIIILFAAIKFISPHKLSQEANSFLKDYVGLKYFTILPLLIPLFFVYSNIADIQVGYFQFKELMLNSHFVEAILGSFTVGIVTGLAILSLFLFLAYIYPSKLIETFFNGYMAPSTAITGFALMLLPPYDGVALNIKICIGLVLVIFPALYKMRMVRILEVLYSQIKCAQLMGASHFLIYKKIVFPQVVKPFSRVAAIGSFWASGDFGITVFLSTSENTLAMIIKNLLYSYKLELGIFISWIMIAVGFLCYVFILGVGYVLHKKFRV